MTRYNFHSIIFQNHVKHTRDGIGTCPVFEVMCREYIAWAYESRGQVVDGMESTVYLKRDTSEKLKTERVKLFIPR